MLGDVVREKDARWEDIRRRVCKRGIRMSGRERI